jgi:predicted amidophosphoribosyltransferase
MKTIAERRENMRRAFEVPAKFAPRVHGRSFLLVDDVMTSGATLDQAAWALKQRGARLVDAVVFARGLGATKSFSAKTA